MSRGGAEGEGDIESEAGSRLRAVSTEPDMGLKLTNPEIMTSQSRSLNRLRHPGSPLTNIILTLEIISKRMDKIPYSSDPCDASE